MEKKTAQDLIDEALVDKCLSDENGNYFYIRERYKNSETMCCLSLDFDELQSYQDIELCDVTDLKVVTKEEFLDALTKYIKETIKYE